MMVWVFRSGLKPDNSDNYNLHYGVCVCCWGHRFDGSESVVIVAAQKRTLGGRELQLPCMSSLTSKTSTQKFFLRVLQVIIQLREDTRRANKKAKQTGRLGKKVPRVHGMLQTHNGHTKS